MNPTAAAINPGVVIAALAGLTLVVGSILLLVHHHLGHRRQLALARYQASRPQRSSSYTVTIWRDRALAAEEQIEALRREVWLARDSADQLAQQLSASRAIGRRQERDRLALTTLVIEANQTGQMPVLPGPPSEPTPTVTPLNRRHRVLRSA